MSVNWDAIPVKDASKCLDKATIVHIVYRAVSDAEMTFADTESDEAYTTYYDGTLLPDEALINALGRVETGDYLHVDYSNESGDASDEFYAALDVYNYYYIATWRSLLKTHT